jgi:hypothetical protein
LESDNEPSKSGESYLAEWYLEVQEFQIWLSFRILFRPNCCPVWNSFSSFADAQNFVTSKLLLGSGYISNQWKAGRVFQFFGIQLRGRIPSEQPHNLIFLQTCNLPRISVSRKIGHRSKIVTLKPSTVCGRVKDRWKPERVLFYFGVQLQVEFHVEQSRCHYSLMLLLIEVKQSQRTSWRLMIRFHEFPVIVQSYMFLMSCYTFLMAWTILWQMVRTRSSKGMYDDVPESSTRHRGTFYSLVLWATADTVKCHRAKVVSNQWTTSSTIAASSTAPRVLLL